MATVNFKVHKYQGQALTSPSRFTALISGVQGGKTTIGVYWLALQVQQDKTKDYLVVFPTYRVGNQSSMKKFKSLFPNWGTFIMRDMEYRLKEGGKIYFRSAEDPQSLEGITAKAAWVDEAGQINSLAWETIQARLSIAKGKCLLTTTPYAMNWLYHDFYKKWEDGDPTYKVIQYASVESPWFPKDEYERQQGSLDARRFKLKFKGEFTKFEGLVYNMFDRRIHVVKPHKLPDMNGKQVICGVDYGFKAPLVILWAYKDEEDNIVVFKEFYQSGVTIKGVAPKLKDFSPSRIYVDPSAKGFIAELSSIYSIPNVVPADNKKSPGVSRVQSLFNTNKIKIFNTCRNLIDELESYRYKETRDGNISDEPEKKDDHACDALRYLLHTAMARPSLSVAPRMQPTLVPAESNWAYGS